MGAAEVDEGSPLDDAATAARLHALGRAGVLDTDDVAEALAIAAGGPDAAGWRGLATRLLTGAGAGLCVAGVIFFFAANWDELHRFARLGAVGGVMVAVAALAVLRRGTLAGRVALTAAVGLVGATLAVYGQVYQTGADVWTLFAGWALLTLPWALAGRFEPLWVLWLVVVELAVGLWIEQIAPREHAAWTALLMAVAPAAAWAAGERLGAARWFGRTAFAAAATAMVVAVCFELVAREPSAALLVGLAGLVGAAVVALRRPVGAGEGRRLDLVHAATLAAAAMTIVTVGAGRLVITSVRFEVGGVIVLAVLVIAEAGAAAMWLRRLWRAGAR